MHGERSEFSPGEVKNNVVEFESHDQPAEKVVKHIFDKLSPHQKSLEILKDAGYDSLEQAVEELKALKEEEQQAFMSFWAKIKDRISNQGQEVKKITDLEDKIHKLARIVRIANITSRRESMEKDDYTHQTKNDNVIKVPESVWPGPEKLKPDNSEEETEFRKAA